MWGKFHGLSQNYFEIFQLPIQYALDEKKLDASYRAILSSIHPDRFVNATEAEKTQSLMKSTLVNDAYTILKNPIQRAEYLLEINSVSQHVKLDHAFLMQQMEWEERLEAEENVAPLNQFHDEDPEAANDVVTWHHGEIDPWYLAFTPGLSPVDVVIDGEVVLAEGRPTRVDPNEVRAKAAEQARRLFARLG